MYISYEFVENLSKNPWVWWITSLLSIIGVLISLYFGVKKTDRKAIRYQEFKINLRNQSTYIIAIWNAGNSPLFYEDICNKNPLQVYSQHPVDKIEEKYISDSDSDFKLEEVNKIKHYIKFDFLLCGQGGIIIAQGNTNQYCPMIRGRIRGEKVDSCKKGILLDYVVVKKFLLCIIVFLSAISSALQAGMSKDLSMLQIMSINLVIIIQLIVVVVGIRDIKREIIPRKLKNEVKKIQKQYEKDM